MVSFFRRCSGLINDPVGTFLELKDAGIRTALVPLFIQIITTGVLLLIYYQWVNFDWLLTQLAKGMSPTEGKVLVKILTRATLSTSSMLGSALIIPLVTLIFALYFFLFGKIYNIDKRYSQWFVFFTWASMPTVLTLPLGLFAMLMSDGRLMTDQINPLALNVLLDLDDDSSWRTLASSVTVLLIMSNALTIIGFRTWTGFSWLRSFVVSMLPFAVIYAPWAGIVVASSQW